MFNRTFNPAPPKVEPVDPGSLEALLLEMKKDEIAKKIQAKRVQEVLEGTPTDNLSGKYVTGYCSNSAHEGVVRLSASGLRMQSCKGEYTFRFGVKVVKCTCFCHSPEFQSSLPEPDDIESDSPFSEQTASIRAMLIACQMTRRVPQITHADAVEAGDDAALLTDSGRMKRGALESVVFDIVTGILSGRYINPDSNITPQSVVIVYKFTKKPIEYIPSEGAVYSIFKRWSEMGCATLEEKPFRLVSLSDEIIKKGPQQMKFELERASQRANKRFF